ncbi:peroxisomal multifunctional enzyme type 2 [Fusarium albosuccineum]|uniref:Peroxisomal multifunctional enzyme type 2 n=1 Tax=Fusarium albosuccineum TaxID=1237068 RepID=A0A8H4KB54_9HYPO|nr:peroxisomal multifunctional enzyme type 2 [Fusarium albosuccineum]
MSPPARKDAFTNRTVIVTGAAGSIGKPLCIALARSGANVVANDVGCSPSGQGFSSTSITQLAAELKREGLSIVADTNSVATAADKIVANAISQFGRIDAIINTAGIIHYKSVEDQDLDGVRQIFEVNALGAYALCHFAWPHMKERRYGRIVNFTSDSVFGMPNSSAYVMARGAMLGVTRTLAVEGKEYGILVNTVGPSAYSRMVADVSQDLPKEQLEWFKATYTGESNLPVILALASEQNKATGEIWTSGAYKMGRTILGTVQDVDDIHTADQALEAMETLGREGRISKEPRSIQEFLTFKAQAR